MYRKITHPEFLDTFVMDIPFSMKPKTPEIRIWLTNQEESTLFIGPVSPELPGLLYFHNEEFASLFMLKWL